MSNLAVVESIVLDLLEQGVIEFVPSKPICVNPLGLVSKLKDGEIKHRLVFDASRWINLHTDPKSVKLAHLDKALQMTHKGDFQVIFDLRSAYYNIKIAPKHTHFLGAAFMLKGTKQYFIFKHLPFGLNSAVHAITKLWKPLVSYIHNQGIRFSIYIDDGRILADNADEAEKHRVFVYNVAQKAGWQISLEKSDKANAASQYKKYLGFFVDSNSMMVFYPSDNLKDFVSKVRKAIAKPKIQVKELSSILGKMISLFPSHGAIVRICTRSGYIMLESHVAVFGWTGYIHWSKPTLKEFSFFLSKAFKFNGSRIADDLFDVRIDYYIQSPLSSQMNHPLQQNIDEILVSDASDTKAVVKWLQGSSPGFSFIFKFSVEESNLSSGERELIAVERLMQHSLQEGNLTNANILWLTDSTNLVSFIRKGSPKPSIQARIFNILVLCAQLKCTIDPIHLFREDERIKEVDSLSKSNDSDNWSIDYVSFESFNNDFHFEVDLFADQNNTRAPSFASKFYHPNSIGVDAFSIEWSQISWVCPPTSLLCKVIKRIRSSPCQGLLIVPNWPASDFYCELFYGPNTLAPFQFISEFRPYIFQNEGARNTPLFGKTSFSFFALYFNTK